MDFPTALRETIAELGLTAVEVASVARVSSTMIPRYLRGATPSYTIVRRLMDEYPSLAKRLDNDRAVA